VNHLPAPHPSPAIPARPHGRAARAAKPRVLCVDDEPQVLDSLRDALRRRFDVIATTNGFEALRMLATEPCQVVLSDMRMPMLDGARFLTLAREHAPDTVRLLLTGQSTLEHAVAAVNDGEIFRFLLKPCPTPELVAALDAAVERHETLVRERELGEETLRETVRAFSQMAEAVDPTAPRRSKRIRDQAVDLAAAAGLAGSTRDLERACELMQAGTLGLTPETRGHLAQGRRLGRNDAADLERLPELAVRLVGHITLLDPVVRLLSAATRPLRPAPHDDLATTAPAARVLRIVLDFDLLELQGVPPGSALEMLRGRTDRYDGALLETFADLQGIR
jgi:response regulator RpfG family c-di-GMP phosphodiesterase